MFKMLLASTALTALVTGSALAASHMAATDTNAATSVMTDKADAMHVGATLASDLIGSAVYGSENKDADMIGDINDIVITPEGEVASVIIGVGGFLGIGEKDVAVEYDTIKWVDRDGERWIVANMSREQLEAAPAFDRTTIYTEARSEEKDTAATKQTAAEATAERVEDGTSAVAMAEDKTEKTMGIDRSAMTPVSTDQLSADNLIGRTVYGANDENIGEVSDVLLSSDNKVEGFVLDVGGFLGMGEKPVAISPQNLTILANSESELTVFTPFTEEQLKAQKEYSKETWEADRDSIIMIVPAG